MAKTFHVPKGVTVVYSETLVLRVRHLIERERGLSERKMFGSLCFLLHGNLWVGVWHYSLIARLGVNAATTALDEPFVRPMDMAGKPMKGWVVIEPDGLESGEQLRGWIERAREFVATLPRK